MCAMRHLHKLALLLIGWLGAIALGAQLQEDIIVHSDAMDKDIHNLIMLPESYDGQRSFPVVYLLHGHNMKYHEWLRVQRELPQLATRHGVILVCPDGANSWYWDSPINPAMRYETYVARELPQHIQKRYKAIDDKDARAITGLSMGGHGALWLAIRHQDVFGSCGAMSGGVDIRPFPNKWNMADSLGAYKDNPQRWNEHTVMTQLVGVDLKVGVGKITLLPEIFLTIVIFRVVGSDLMKKLQLPFAGIFLIPFMKPHPETVLCVYF